MSNTETAQIIYLFGPRSKRGKTGSKSEPVSKALQTSSAGSLLDSQLRLASQHREVKSSATAENFRLRQEHYDVWRQADATMDYWHAAMKMHTAISCMQNFGAPDGDRYPFVMPEDHGTMVKRYRLAWCKLMLTPAPNTGYVRSKNMQLIAKHYEYIGLSPERIQQAIDADVEWPEAHPVRGCKRKPSNSGQQQ